MSIQRCVNIDEFNENGFIVVPQLVSKEQIQTLFKHIENLLDETLALTNIHINQDASIDEKYLKLKEERSTIKAHLYDLTSHLHFLWTIYSSENIVNLVKQLLNCDTVLMDIMTLRIDDDADDRLVPIHQELGQISTMHITVWIPMVDVTEETGGLCYFPKSHKQGEVSAERYPEVNNLYGVAKELIDTSKMEHINFKAGDGLLFHPCLFHGSTSNKVKRIRWTMVCRFNNLHDIPYLQHDNAPYRTPFTEPFGSRYGH